jgi:hypothetical protein
MKTKTPKTANLSRRRFIVGSATVAGGGLALGLPLPFGIGAKNAGAAAATGAGVATPEIKHGCRHARRALRDPSRAGNGPGA